MLVIYAEKADVGNKIAAALGGFSIPGGPYITFKNRVTYEEEIKKLQKRQGYLDITFKGEPCRVTWGYGHLYGLQDVPEYDNSYKAWKSRPICFIPDEFKLHATSSSLANFQKVLDNQRRIVKECFQKADRIINATDYDREGELIFAYVYEAMRCKKPFDRVLFTSQTEEGIKKAFDKLIPSSKVKSIEYAGRARSIYDWLIGTNLSTQMTLRYPGNGVLSIGRVQTPVLKMVVDREEAIASFVPKISWNIKGTFQVNKDESYSGLYKGNGEMDKKTADDLVRKITGKTGVVTKLESKRSKREVPLLYSQTSLQIDASKYFGYTAKDTLDAAQFLYDNGYTSYPRTKSQHLTDDMKADVIKTLTTLSTHPDYEKYLKGRAITPAKKFFNSSKVISHYAIIPTGELPKSLSSVQKNIYDLIVWSLIRTIYPEAIVEKTTVITTVDNEYDFSSSGSTVIDPGWLSVNVKTKETFLPAITKGAAYPGIYEGKETKTEPPKRYDDGSLVKAMRTAGKDLDDAAFRAILADPNVEGIGTDATRAEIIETLLKRQYIERKGKVFYATEKGIDLIHSIPVPDMMSAEFTARMEQNLSKIEEGTLDYHKFLEQVYLQVQDWCNVVSSSTSGRMSGKSPSPPGSFSAPAFEEEEDNEPPLAGSSSSRKLSISKPSAKKSFICPVCGEEFVKGSKAWNCLNPECNFHIFLTILSHKLTDKEVKALICKGTTDKIDNFISQKTGKKFSAKLVLDENTHNISFDFK